MMTVQANPGEWAIRVWAIEVLLYQKTAEKTHKQREYVGGTNFFS